MQQLTLHITAEGSFIMTGITRISKQMIYNCRSFFLLIIVISVIIEIPSKVMYRVTCFTFYPQSQNSFLKKVLIFSQKNFFLYFGKCHFLILKVHSCKFGNFPLCSNLYKNNTLKILQP